MALRRNVGKYSPVSTRAPESDAAPVDRTRIEPSGGRFLSDPGVNGFFGSQREFEVSRFQLGRPA